jgi:mono/diheme cytochrome c family protein
MRLLINSGFVLLSFVTLIFAGFFVYWQSASPARTCASCHEIQGAHEVWAESPHRDIECAECHGTALSAGLHSMEEKARMVFTHFSRPQYEDIRMNERQAVEAMAKCSKCHAQEHADWLSGGHSATYADIFLNEKHNKEEQLSESCLRCHGMFFAGSVAEVARPLDVTGPWTLVNPALASVPAIPCLACHEIHVKGSPAARPDYSDPSTIAAKRPPRSAKVGFYDRYEKMLVAAADLPRLALTNDGRAVQVATDEHQRVCVQCHAPNAFHQAGSSDDRTPRGVHEGLSCSACHATHSNDARESCVNCHPRLSNCGLEVEKMNTSYFNPASANNIHFVECADCHAPDFVARARRRSFARASQR